MGKYLKVLNRAESTYGETITGTFTAVRAKSVSYPVDRGLLLEENIESYIPVAAYGGALKVSGSIEGNLRPRQMQQLIAACFGASSALGGSDPITSGIKYTLGLPTSTQLKIGEQTQTGGSYEIELDYRGVGIKTMNLTVNSKEFVTAKFDWFAKDYATGTYSAPATTDYVSEDPTVFYNATIGFAGGAAVFNVRSMSINIDRKVDEDRYVVGDFTVQELGINGLTDISGDITFTEKEYNMFKAALYGSSGASTIPTTNAIYSPAFLITFTNQAEVAKAYMKFSSMAFGGTDTTITGQNVIEKKISWKATGDASSFEFGMALT